MAKQSINQELAKNRAPKSVAADSLSKQSTIVTLQNSIGNRAVQHLLVQRQENDEYADEAYGIMNSSMDPQLRLQLLVKAQNRRLAKQGVPPVGLGKVKDSKNLGEGDSKDWELDLNTSAMNTSTPAGRADVADTVGHEGEHLRQWYEMARLQAGLQRPKGPLNRIPDDVAGMATLNPILESNEQTYQVEQWYESVYGSGAQHREQVLGDTENRYEEYRALPEERDGWARGDEITGRFKELEDMAARPRKRRR